jgi:prevent-host-death family protein
LEAPVSETRVGIRELKSRLSAYLRQVKAGTTVLITDRGQPVGRIVPVSQPLQARLEAMAQSGLILWSGNKPSPVAPVARTQGQRTVAELLIEDRS